MNGAASQRPRWISCREQRITDARDRCAARIAIPRDAAVRIAEFVGHKTKFFMAMWAVPIDCHGFDYIGPKINSFESVSGTERSQLAAIPTRNQTS